MHASRLSRLWLQDDDIGVSGDERLNCDLTLYDRKAFLKVMDPNPSSTYDHNRISDVYHYFADQLAAWSKNSRRSGNCPLRRAGDTIYENLLFVPIESQHGDNPQSIFESLNA